MRVDRSLLVVVAGVTAAIHIAKLPPALPALHEALGISLVQAGFLISMSQLAAMVLGLAVGLAADALGLRRVMVTGLALTTVASVAGGLTTDVGLLLVLRAIEGLGFLLAVTPAPSLLRRYVPAQAMQARLGLWAAYMPLGVALALLVGPVWIAWAGWPAWWWLTAGLTGVMALAIGLLLPPDPVAVAIAPGAWRTRLLDTLRAPGPWLVSLAFAVYSAQWLSVVGFLPSIYAQAGLAPAVAGVATAMAAAANMVGNILAGRLLQRGVPPERLMQIGYVAMAAGGLMLFTPVWPAGWASAVVPYAGVLLFSALGGLIPGTLFAQAIRVAPGPGAVSTTVGWMQQWSSFGQFVGPPFVAWVASRVGSWSYSGLVTAACAATGLVLATRIGRLLRAHP